jgi:hypothetical protein
MKAILKDCKIIGDAIHAGLRVEYGHDECGIAVELAMLLVAIMSGDSRLVRYAKSEVGRLQAAGFEFVPSVVDSQAEYVKLPGKSYNLSHIHFKGE